MKQISPQTEKAKSKKKVMKIDNKCLRTYGNAMFKEKVYEFLDSLSENDTEENKQLSFKQILIMCKKHII